MHHLNSGFNVTTSPEFLDAYKYELPPVGGKCSDVLKIAKSQQSSAANSRCASNSRVQPQSKLLSQMESKAKQLEMIDDDDRVMDLLVMHKQRDKVVSIARSQSAQRIDVLEQKARAAAAVHIFREEVQSMVLKSKM